MKQLVIFGASTLAKLAHFYATGDLNRTVSCFVVDDQYWTGADFLSLPVLAWSDFSVQQRPENVSMFVAIGYRIMRARANAYNTVKAAGYELVNIVAKSGYVASDVVMGDNNFIMPGAVLEPGVALASNNIVWSNATICHDSMLGSHNFVAANATVGGGVSIGNGNFLGFSSVIMQGRKIGDDTLIGAQSLVRGDTQNLCRYYGSPAVFAGAVDPELGIMVN